MGPRTSRSPAEFYLLSSMSPVKKRFFTFSDHNGGEVVRQEEHYFFDKRDYFENVLKQSKEGGKQKKQNFIINLDDYEEDRTEAFFRNDGVQNIRVRKVRSKLDSRIYALKTIVISDTNLIANYFQEAEIMRRLNHKNMVKIYGYGLKENHADRTFTLGILMEYFEYDLNRLINEHISKKKHIEKSELRNIVLSLISGLLYLQFKRIFHGDLKPSNILLSGKIVKIGWLI